MRPSEKDYTDLRWLLTRLQASEDWCRPYFERAKRHYQLYRFGSAVKEEDWPYVNRVRSRDILAFIEDSTAILVQTLFATTPFFSVLPRETEMMYQQHSRIDPQKVGDQIAKCLDYQISHEDTEFFEEIVDFLKGGTILGNSYMGVYPKFNREGRYLRPLLKTTDFWDVLPIAGAKRVSKARGVFIRDFQSIEELERLQEEKVYKNVDLIKAPESSGSDPEKDWHRALLEEVGLTNYHTDENDVEVLHYFSGGHVMTLGDRKVILRDSNKKGKRPFPYDMPIVQYKYMPVPLEFFAMGIPEVLEALQEDKNLIRSARRDNIDLCINKILKAKTGADINFDLIKYYAGAIWPLDNLDDIQEMDQSDVTQSSYQEEAMREHDMENALSLFGYARGMTPQHSEQPTTVMKLQQASLNRLDLAVKLAEFTTLQNIAARIIMLTRRYMDQEDYEAIVGGPDAGFYQMTEEDIKRFYFFKPMGSSVTHVKEVRLQQIQAALQTALNIPPEMRMNNIEPYTLNLYAAEKELYDAVDVRNPDRLLVKMPNEQQAQEQGGVDMQGMMSGLGDLMNVPYGGR
jgi:hypothetical protein